MFWDNVAGVYEIFEKGYNGKVNMELGARVASLIESSDKVLECACGTGLISKAVAPCCKALVATDFSEGMLKQSKKNFGSALNVRICKANIMKLNCKDDYFDKVIAGNVIHLLDEPEIAFKELLRVCKPGGKVIIPTYVNNENDGEPNVFVKGLEKFGANFKRQFDYSSYKQFFAELGCEKVEYDIIEGKMPCAIAIIEK